MWHRIPLYFSVLTCSLIRNFKSQNHCRIVKITRNSNYKTLSANLIASCDIYFRQTLYPNNRVGYIKMYIQVFRWNLIDIDNWEDKPNYKGMFPASFFHWLASLYVYMYLIVYWLLPDKSVKQSIASHFHDVCCVVTLISKQSSM